MLGFQSVLRDFRHPSSANGELLEEASHQRGLETTDSRRNQPCPGICIHGLLLLLVFRSSIPNSSLSLELLVGYQTYQISSLRIDKKHGVV